ncbi:MAG: NUDIX domain-containing protein [Gammaproteobacteria bacterium]|nr:NUDIX domain-containing protein [Gammaproteobacteria bacterium]
MTFEVEIKEEEMVFEGFLGVKRIHLRHSLFAGGKSPVVVRELVESYRAATVLLYDPDMDCVVLIEQFRVGALGHRDGCWVLEVIGGIVEGDEPIEEVARREALEEAGCEVGELIPVCEFMVSPGYTTERIHLFCGRVDASIAGGIHGLDHEGEDIRVEVIPADEAIAELYGGRINSTSSIIAIQWFMMNRQRLRDQWLGKPGCA